MELGTRVHDRDDDSPDDAVVVASPDGTTIADWEYEVDGQTYTTAESNPDYPEDDSLVLICFVPELEADWSDWTDASPEELEEGAREHDVRLYGFPESRLVPADEAAAERPDAFDTVQDRLEENGFDVRYDEASVALEVEKYGDAYVITSDGEVEGEGGLRRRVTSIVSRFF